MRRVFVLLAGVACNVPTPPTPPAPSPDPPAVFVTTGCSHVESDLDRYDGVLERMDRAVEANSLSLVRKVTPMITRLLAESALRTSKGEPAVALPATDRALVDWWDRGGANWILSARGNSAEPGRDRPRLASPPTMRSVVDPKRLPGEVLCPDGPCDREAEDFMQEDAQLGLVLEAYLEGRAHGAYSFAPKRLHSPWPVYFEALPHGCPEDNYAQWAACVAERRSVRPVFPIGDYRMPRSGWLFVEPSLKEYASCPNFTAIDLATGAAIWTRDCTVLWGRGNLQSVREFALVAALAGTEEEVIEQDDVAVPAHLAGQSRCSLGSTPAPFVRRKVVRRRDEEGHRLAVWWANRGRIVLDVRLDARPPDEPGARMADRLFTVVDHTLAAGGDAPSVPDLAGVADEQLTTNLRRIHPGLGVMETQRQAP